MTSVRLTLGHDMHARPVASFCSTAHAAGVRVTLARIGDVAVDADDMLRLMAAGLRAGEQVELTVDGPASVLMALRGLLLVEE